VKLFNSLRIRKYGDPGEIAAIINTLASITRFHVEIWFPKVSCGEGVCGDLRILVIAGQARHTVLRTSRSPFTNLHLGNKRGDLESLVRRMGESRWQEVRKTAVDGAALFPACHYVAVDMMVSPTLNKIAVAELNAFGDLLPSLQHRGEETYQAELAALAGRTVSKP
jgi:hypothetical protein